MKYFWVESKHYSEDRCLSNNVYLIHQRYCMLDRMFTLFINGTVCLRVFTLFIVGIACLIEYLPFSSTVLSSHWTSTSSRLQGPSLASEGVETSEIGLFLRPMIKYPTGVQMFNFVTYGKNKQAKWEKITLSVTATCLSVSMQNRLIFNPLHSKSEAIRWWVLNVPLYPVLRSFSFFSESYELSDYLALSILGDYQARHQGYTA